MDMNASVDTCKQPDRSKCCNARNRAVAFSTKPSFTSGQVDNSNDVKPVHAKMLDKPAGVTYLFLRIMRDLHSACQCNASTVACTGKLERMQGPAETEYDIMALG